jgi:hypothetical protein
MLELLTDVLKRLRKLADEHAQTFRSDGFRSLLATLSRELDDDYLRTVGIPARDEHGMTTLSEPRGKGINLAASALAQSTDHVLSFFSMLRAELGFYVSCLNLHEHLIERGEPTCFLAAAGRADDDDEPTVANLEGQVVDGAGSVRVDLGDELKGDSGHRSHSDDAVRENDSRPNRGNQRPEARLREQAELVQ